MLLGVMINFNILFDDDPRLNKRLMPGFDQGIV
jgi:hypothetical protein